MLRETDKLTQLRRPKILAEAVRAGLKIYCRHRDLPKILGSESITDLTNTREILIQAEADLDEKRKTGDASYSVTRHIEVLIALVSEALTLPPQSTA